MTELISSTGFFSLFNFVVGLPIYGAIFCLIFLGLIVSSVLMVMGIQKCNRGYMLPWLIIFGGLIFFQFLFGLWLFYGYYIYVSPERIFLIISLIIIPAFIYSYKPVCMELLLGYGWPIM